MKLFIYRWFGGSVHPMVWWTKKKKNPKQWSYPRLANYAVPMMAGAIVTGGHLFFVVGFCMVVPLFLYTALNPLSLEEWYECYSGYWWDKGYALIELSNQYSGIRHPKGTTHFVKLKTKREAIRYLFFEIYDKTPMRV